eukprot:1184423-Prorocentrum_minimum.AAC.2
MTEAVLCENSCPPAGAIALRIEIGLVSTLRGVPFCTWLPYLSRDCKMSAVLGPQVDKNPASSLSSMSVFEGSHLFARTNTCVVNARAGVVNSRAALVNSRAGVVNSRAAVVNSRAAVVNSRAAVVNSRTGNGLPMMCRPASKMERCAVPAVCAKKETSYIPPPRSVTCPTPDNLRAKGERLAHYVCTLVEPGRHLSG